MYPPKTVGNFWSNSKFPTHFRLILTKVTICMVTRQNRQAIKICLYFPGLSRSGRSKVPQTLRNRPQGKQERVERKQFPAGKAKSNRRYGLRLPQPTVSGQHRLLYCLRIACCTGCGGCGKRNIRTGKNGRQVKLPFAVPNSGRLGSGCWIPCFRNRQNQDETGSALLYPC